MNHYLKANWNAPKNIHAYTTTRVNGYSTGSYASFNLGDHVGDAESLVTKNRAALYNDLQLPSAPLWLKQVHGNTILSAVDWQQTSEADGCYSNQPGNVCVVMTADCLPILLCNKTGTEIMALHGGWRSLALGIIANGIAKFQSQPADILVWLGPAIGATVYEVGDEVKNNFLNIDLKFEAAFKQSPNARWLMDIYHIARIQLSQLGVVEIFGGNHCTFQEEQSFFSFRRDNITGRMASLIWCNYSHPSLN